MYSILTEDFESKRAKGVKKGVVKREIKHQHYKDTLFSGTQMHSSMKTIRSDHHRLISYKLNKIGLSSYDNKRFIIENGCDASAHGYYKTSEYLEEDEKLKLEAHIRNVHLVLSTEWRLGRRDRLETYYKIM